MIETCHGYYLVASPIAPRSVERVVQELPPGKSVNIKSIEGINEQEQRKEIGYLEN